MISFSIILPSIKLFHSDSACPYPVYFQRDNTPSFIQLCPMLDHGHPQEDRRTLTTVNVSCCGKIKTTETKAEDWSWTCFQSKIQLGKKFHSIDAIVCHLLCCHIWAFWQIWSFCIFPVIQTWSCRKPDFWLVCSSMGKLYHTQCHSPLLC